MTTINEEKIAHLTNKPAKFKELVYPKPILPNIQRPFFVCCAIGERGQGKSYAVVRMLLNQEQSGFICHQTGNKTAIRHVLFSPTVEGNPVFQTLRYLDDDDIYNDFTEQALLDLLEEIKEEKKKSEDYWDYVEAFKTFENMSKKQFMKWDDTDAIMLLESNNFCHYRELEKPKYPDGVVVNIILDDLLANKEAFNSKRGSVLLKSVLNSRHYGINIIFCAQNMKSISKPIRLNTSVWILFRFKSHKIILQDLYPEISSLVNEEQFLAIYEYATKDDHNALVVDNTEKIKEDRFKKNLDVVLRFSNNKNTSNITEEKN